MVPAFAANTCENSTTGPLSENTCTVINRDTVTVNNVNDAQIVNKVSTKSNTGGNSASMNTLGGTITTGDAVSNVQVQSVANINTTNITGGLATGGNTGSNSITGPSSTNSVYMENNHTVAVTNDNTATVRNRIDVDSNTGWNDANTNTGPAVIKTGDASLGLAVLNHANDNLNDIRGSAAGAGTNVAENSTTGPFSENTVAIINRYAAAVNNVNDLQVKNEVDAWASSGKNDANKNTLGGDIETGDADAAVGVETEGNINTTKVAMAMGGFSNYGENSVTGPDPDGIKDPSIYIENTRTVNVNNINNKCQSYDAATRDWNMYHRGPQVEGCDDDLLGVFNYVDADSVTGGNDADLNTGGGGVATGMAGLIQEVLTHLNDTLTEIL
jgi:hypothetical protein